MRSTALRQTADHPRERGEHRFAERRVFSELGSSPRARGTRYAGSSKDQPCRIIPASAGNTSVVWDSKSSQTDHPRERGEHRDLLVSLANDTGSSPRARGTPLLERRYIGFERIIPASAGNTGAAFAPASWRSDHPRERGEHGGILLALEEGDGSSPRARGTRHIGMPLLAGERIIPASAGNTPARASVAISGTDHPRERGEHPCLPAARRPGCGSSPRARGTRRGCRDRPQAGRIIPASAGNTRGGHVQRYPGPDHPRERGEHGYPHFGLGESVGSSPRARGTHFIPPRLSLSRRIIPASAGNTHLLASVPCGYTDHPRERGEHSLQKTPLLCYHGSSPRARGTPDVHPSGRDCGRIIPASAGNTSPIFCKSMSPTDHPRERGEHWPRGPMTSSPTGSSPRARGTRWGRLPQGFSTGIIPASAGNTPQAREPLPFIPDHPRERGEHGAHILQGGRNGGSSPRARGTLADDVQVGVRKRIIPASAGNTWGAWTLAAGITDHPRERGEHCSSSRQQKTNPGSSPRARGTRKPPTPTKRASRIIPASAGNTFPESLRAFLASDHPRERGEHADVDRLVSPHAGSSPRARGTPRRLFLRGHIPRIIPASAGNTSSIFCKSMSPTDHPRERGEHRVLGTRMPTTFGSSPRARGTLEQDV